MTKTRTASGYLGAVMCVGVFFFAVAGSASILVPYVSERHSNCGTGIGELRFYAATLAITVVGGGLCGLALASHGGFTSHWWRFFRNIAGWLGVLTAFVVMGGL